MTKTKPMPTEKRLLNYMKQRRSGVLTAPQKRRLNKKRSRLIKKGIEK